MDRAEHIPDSPNPVDRNAARFTLVGSGIASMAAAVFLIRDGDILGRNITILEALDTPGGSLDASGSAEHGYVLRGGRMFESKYLCTFELFSSIPSLDDTRSVMQEIFAWNETLKTSSKSRLFRDGQRQVAPEFGLSERHILTIERLGLEPEALLGQASIAEQFDADFFTTNFWFMWCTTFAFQPWHSAIEFKRYLLRFAHMVGGFNRLLGIMRTTYNQYDSMVRPLLKWLDARGVTIQYNTRVTDLGLSESAGGTTVTHIATEQDGKPGRITVGAGDCVLVTLGSMTEASSLGGMDTAPVLNGKQRGGAWALWEKIAAGRPAFGHPSVFCDHIEQSKWVSFTTTLHDPTLLRLIRDATGNVPGEGGLITFPQSKWLASIVIPHQPHFMAQPADVSVFWGYGLFVDKPGNFVEKPMSACNRPRDYDRNTRSPAHRLGGGADSAIGNLRPLHDAFYHQPVPAAPAWRPAADRARGIDQPCVHGAVLRAATGCGVHRRILDPLGAGGGQRAAWPEARAARGLSGQVRSARAVQGVRGAALHPRVTRPSPVPAAPASRLVADDVVMLSLGGVLAALGERRQSRCVRSTFRLLDAVPIPASFPSCALYQVCSEARTSMASSSRAARTGCSGCTPNMNAPFPPAARPSCRWM